MSPFVRAQVSGRCTVVVGGQWGDEGKGKIVDVLTAEADLVARYQGGANAGHTVQVGDETFIFHLIPSGILHPGKRCLLGNGVVLDPVQFFQEYEAAEARGVAVEGRVGVSHRAHLLLPYHKLLDRAREGASIRKIGTTGRGIGPAYEDKAARRGIRVVDLEDRERARSLLAEGLERTRAKLRELGMEDLGEAESCVEETLALAGRLSAMATDVGLEIQQAILSGKKVLLEGAQGTALDIDHGTYPYVTSSNTTAGGAACGVGIGPTSIHEVLGVVKAYITRVGEGPLPTVFPPELDQKVRDLGSEYGATTGRPRRCGWYDGVLARYSSRVNGLTGLAVTKLDVLDFLPEVKIAVAYRTPQGETREFPADTMILGRVEPVYETLPGWQETTAAAARLEDLPAKARAYLDRLEEVSETPIRMISVGTRRDQIIRVG